MTAVHAFAHIDTTAYVPHDLHRAERAWGESNCYIDVWIEVLHALGLDPLACMSFVLSADWEGDQWTFFKPPHEDLTALYGVDVQELTVWRPLIQNAVEQLKNGKIVLSEVDAFFLPDTAGTDYRAQHTKTTIGIQEIDLDKRELCYFHNSSYHLLKDQDFVGLFRLDKAPDPTFMPFFAEFVRLERVQRLAPPELTKLSIELMKKHLGRRPKTNPVSRFRPRFISDVEALKTEGIAAYHQYAFASLRQLGAAFEFGALYIRWLGAHGEAGLDDVAADFDEISQTTKSLILKGARAVSTKKPTDFGPMLETIETCWARSMDRLTSRYGV